MLLEHEPQAKVKKEVLIRQICEFTEIWIVTQRDIKGHIKLH